MRLPHFSANRAEWLSRYRLNSRDTSPAPTPDGFCELDSITTPALGPTAWMRDSLAAISLFTAWSSVSK